MRILIVATLALFACPTVDVVAQPDEDQIDGKTVFLSRSREVIEDVRLVSLMGTPFLVTRPSIMTIDGVTFPKAQTWIKLSDELLVEVAGTKAAAEKRLERYRGSESFRESEARIKHRFFEHSADYDDPFGGKIVLLAGSGLRTRKIEFRSLGGHVYLTTSGIETDMRLYTKLSSINRMIVFDTLADAREHERLRKENRDWFSSPTSAAQPPLDPHGRR